MMSKATKISIALTALLFLNGAVAEPFVGFKLSTPDFDNAKREPTNLAINVGKSLDTWVADLSLVGEFSYTIDQGRTDRGEELELTSGAAYVVWKTTRSMYVSLRGGVVANEITEADDSSFNRGLLLGASLGQVIGRTKLQIEYTRLATDADFYGISLEFDL